jgi:hypothetical protein
LLRPLVRPGTVCRSSLVFLSYVGGRVFDALASADSSVSRAALSALADHVPAWSHVPAGSRLVFAGRIELPLRPCGCTPS